MLVSPMMPHLAETCWRALGREGMIVDAAWPKADPDLVRSESIRIAVQVNGKLKGTVELPRGADNKSAEAAALGLDTVSRALDGKTPRRVIVVPDRIVNVVL